MKYLCLVFLLLLVACGEPPTVKPSNTPTTLSAELQRLLELVNDVRAQGYDCGGDKGVFAPTKPLTSNAKLSMAAQKHSVDLEAAGTKTNMHVTPVGAVNYTSGMTFTERVEAENYDWAWVGENVAYGFSTPEKVMAAWLASPGHCANIMSAKFTELGLGKAGSYWTQDFASPL